MYEKIKMILMNDNQFVSDNLDTDLKIFESNKEESLNYIKIIFIHFIFIKLSYIVDLYELITDDF